MLETKIQWRLKLLLLAMIVAVLTYLGRHTEMDDALIYARYIRNALDGNGLVFNPGEHVNALTSPLFSYLLLGGSWLLKGHILLTTTLLSGIFLFLAVTLAERLVPFAGFLVASTSYFYILVGMESALFLFMLILIVTLYIERKDAWIPIVSILLILTRYEGAAMVFVIAIGLYKAKRIPRWTSYLPVVAVMILYCWLNYHWYGSVIPSSATSKIGQGMSGMWGPWPKAFLEWGRTLIPVFMPMIYIVPLVAFGAIYAVLRDQHREMNLLITSFCGIALAFYILFNIPGYRWYYAPFIFFGMFCACQSIPNAKGFRRGALAIIVLLLISSFYSLKRASTDLSGNYYHLAEWLNQNTLPESRIEASETGTIGWYSPNRYIIDILGLTTPKNAVHIAHRDVSSWLGEDHPDYIIVHDIVHDTDWPWEKVARQSPDYVPVGGHFGNAYVLERKSLVKQSE